MDDAEKQIPFPTEEAALRAFALSLPGAVEEFPWGERVIKVRNKIFVFLTHYKGALRIGMKLPQSREFALDLPNASPSAYGLGKSGWVSFIFEPGDVVDVERFQHWILESYRTIAPKKLSAMIPASG